MSGCAFKAAEYPILAWSNLTNHQYESMINALSILWIIQRGFGKSGAGKTGHGWEGKMYALAKVEMHETYLIDFCRKSRRFEARLVEARERITMRDCYMLDATGNPRGR